MNKVKEDQAGITLVELLAAISILSIVILLAGSVHMFGQRQFIDQTKSASQANDLSYALTVMSTDLRKLKSGEVVVEGDKIIKVNEEALYSIENNQLKKGNEVLIENTTGTFVSESPNSIHIIIGNIAGEGPSKNYETTIYFRR